MSSTSNLCPVKHFIRPDRPHGCTYEQEIDKGADFRTKCPHTSNVKPARNSNDSCSSVLDMIGNTPLIKLKNIASDYRLECNLFAKCENFSAGGSIKDRISLRMIEEAEKAGTIKPGDYIIEPTSGNTGLGLAMTCAVKGYKCIIVMPEKMSKEKADVLKAFGATLIRTPSLAAFDAIDSHISEAQRIMERLNKENPGCAHILDQYTNAYNPIAHYDGTGEEILNQLENGKIDLLVATAGTGGTICGLARKIKEKQPNCIVVGVDPIGSILAQPGELNKTEGSGYYEVEGIGYDFIPTVLDRTKTDYWYKSVDKESFNMSRKVIRREGLLCGGSAGSAVYCALQAIKKFDIKAGQNVVVIMPDSIRNYMTKFLSDDWMITRGFLDIEESKSDLWWTHQPIETLKQQITPVELNIFDESLDFAGAQKQMKAGSVDCLLNFEKGLLKSVVTKKSMTTKLVNGSAQSKDSIMKAALDRFRVLKSTDKLKKLQSTFDSEGYAIVLNENADPESISRADIFAVITADTLLEYITKSG